MDLFEKFFAQNTIIEIPTEVANIGNDIYLKTNLSGKESCGGNILNSSTDGQEIAAKYGSKVQSLCLKLWDKLCTFEHNILSHKRHINFLLSHQLIEEADFKKMKTALKFMGNAYIETVQKKSVLIPLKTSDSYLIFSKNHLSQEFLHGINLLSNDCNDINIFFEKSLLINSYRNMYVMSKLDKMLHSINRKLTLSGLKFENHVKNFYSYQNVHSHGSHLPIVISSKYMIYMHRISVPLYKKEAFCFENNSCITHDKYLPYVEKVLYDVIPSKVPLLLNCVHELSKNSLCTNLNDCSLRNLFFFLLETLVSFYKKKTSSMSCETVKMFENFLLFISENVPLLENHIFKDIYQVLADIVFSLLQDLTFKNSQMVVEHHSQDKQLLNEAMDKVNELKLECENKQCELVTLHDLLQTERENLQGLTVHIKNIESDLNVMMLQKEGWTRKMIEVGKFCSALKIVFSDNCDISKLQSEVANLSDTVCVCQDCLTTVEELGDDNDKKHVPFTPMNVIHHVAMLFTTKLDFEKKVADLKANELSLNNQIGKLENKKNVLSQTVNDLEEVKNISDQELKDLKTKYASLEKEYNNLNLLLSESNSVQENQLKSIEIHIEELNKCKDEYQKLYGENQNLKNDIIQKKEEVSHFEEIIEENLSESRALTIKCNDYQLVIKKLNDTVSKLSADLKDAKDGTSSEFMANVVELKTKIASLEKSKNLLNITLENVEEELQTMYTEKQEIENKLQEKIKEVDCLKLEITSWKNKVAEDEKCIFSLQSSMKELESSVQDSDKKYAELLGKNSALEKDVRVLKREQKELQVVLLEKNVCLKHKNSKISELKESISKHLDEKEELEMNLASIKADFSKELEVKVKLLCNTEEELNFALKERLELEKQIAELEFENKNLKDESDIKLKYQKLSSENCSLKEELKKVMLEKVKLENHDQALNEKIVAMKADVIQLREKLLSKSDNNESVDTLKEALNIKIQSNNENSQMVQELQLRVNELENEIIKNIHEAKKKEAELSFKNSELQEQINALINNSKKSVSDENVKYIHHSKLFIAKINSLLCDVLKSVECNENDSSERKDLISVLANLTHDVKDSNFTTEVYEKVQLFLKNQYLKHKEIEFQICSLTKFIGDSINQVGQYCEKIDSKYKSQIGAFANMDKSCLDISLFVSAAADVSLNNLSDEVKKNFKQLEQCFSLMKDDICSKEVEIKTLQRDLDEVKSRLNPGKLKASDVQALEAKCSLLKLNERRLKEKHNKLLKTCEGMETRIQQLEKEKFELDAEANELAEEIKRQTASDELVETYRALAETTTQLEKLKEENKWLKSTLEQCHSFYQQQSIDSSACDSSIRVKDGNP